jgi:zinc/manganese transport system permease protein
VFQYDFMQNAFIAGTAVAVMCGMVGVFVMARGLSFIAHTFSHIGFSGASFAVLAGWDPFYGLVLFTLASAVAIGRLGVRFFRRDASISVILSLFLGLGILFLHLSAKQASFVSSILFGSVVGISGRDVWQIAGLSVLVLLALALGYRMLKFDSFDPAGAQAAGLPVAAISAGFLVLMSIAVAEAVQIVGALLVFTLMTIPASSARCLTHSVFSMLIVSAALAAAGVWIGLILAYYTNWPASFFITSVEALIYFIALGLQQARERRPA